jgi:hypothetical protein
MPKYEDEGDSDGKFLPRENKNEKAAAESMRWGTCCRYITG